MNIALIEDHEALAHATARFLSEAGYHVQVFESAEALYESGVSTPIDLYLVDLNLPGEDGITFARRLRQVNSRAGIIMVTARGRSEHLEEGYQNGADLYLVKPVDPRLLISAIDSLSRRLNINESVPRFDAELDLTSLTLRGADQQVSVTSVESALLASFAMAPDRFLETWQLAELLGQSLESFNKGRLEVRITRLRKKLSQVTGQEITIKSVRGRGYRLLLSLEMAGNAPT